MKFIEMTGKTLASLVSGEEFDLHGAGVFDDTVVRINEQGDIEVRRPDRWDCVGGLLGGFERRVRQATGLDWV